MKGLKPNINVAAMMFQTVVSKFLKETAPIKRLFENQSHGYKPPNVSGTHIYPYHDNSNTPRVLRRAKHLKNRSKFNTVINRLKKRGVQISDVYIKESRAVRLSQQTKR